MALGNRKGKACGSAANQPRNQTIERGEFNKPDSAARRAGTGAGPEMGSVERSDAPPEVLDMLPECLELFALFVIVFFRRDTRQA